MRLVLGFETAQKFHLRLLFEENEIEAQELAIDAFGITEKMGVEPWRYRIGSNPNSISLDPTPNQGELLPRYIKVSKEASRFENRYLTFDDISPLKIESHNPKRLKQKDMVQLILKGMAKTEKLPVLPISHRVL